MRFFLKGVKVPHRKNTASVAAVRMPSPKTVTIPMSMNIGKPAEPIVNVGDSVFIGTLIAEAASAVSSPIYSSVSGVVTGISDIALPSGALSKAIKIESDGNMLYNESLKAPKVETKEELVEAIKMSGTVGLGGAGFPAHVKFNVPDGKTVSELIINGAECEPYITSDTRTMIDKSQDILFGVQRICDVLKIEKVIIGIENNKAEAIASMKKIAESDERITVDVLPGVYPQGAEKVIVYHTTGKVVPAGKLPIDVGCIVSNCTTVAAIGNYIRTGIPLVNKCVTVDGGAVANPMNVIVPIGTSVGEVFEFAGGFKSEPYKAIIGGPMMGQTIENLDAPVIKNTNAILALTKSECGKKRETACIHCGACTNHCPYGLDPRAFMNAYRTDNAEELEKLRVDICMECGCCSFICPAAKPLVETNRLAKAKLRAYLAEKKAKAELENKKKEEEKQ